MVDVGAGTGLYEQAGTDVTAVDPSRVMFDQHPCWWKILAGAEALPFQDGVFDAAMA
ncbi:class I SAM-dependent methyltransferase [Streptomyces sp. NPDC056362]|uniref:class I SAM-dependent methyltransferase n=1 Tax=unclassified Streptomyces TaxID=2593676 RepID=UPI0035DB6781